ncbi:MAG: DUF2264 domain-containing protein [Paludibacter sp.]|nr:DUF2264 domain-containing protein [Paludibacter sp.]
MKNRTFFPFILFLFSLNIFQVKSDEKKSDCSNIFVIKNPDLNLSPETGMTRKHWFDAARYMLDGAFSYIHTLDDPMKFPKQPGKSYPHNPGQIPTEKLEGLCRTFFVAAPLLKENPDLVINNISVADYYRHQICQLFNPHSESYIKNRGEKQGPSQNLVEFGALAISMGAVPEIIWEPLTQEQKDSLATLMLSYADGPTVDSNWKFFNIFVLSFFKKQGYFVNDKLLEKYLTKSLEHYRGEGWYNDSPAYDYYSMWAFQMYGLLWSHYYGDFYPEIASLFMENYKDLKHFYPYMFDRDGKMIMWGRSISYRYASVAVFPLMGFENDPDTNWGWMRRIASGTILQFFQHPGLMKDGVPTLGFYGPFDPAVQIYSCRGSVYWGGKIFLGLFIPEDSPFWTAKENNGPWDTQFVRDSVYNKFSKGTNILVTDYPAIGASEVRAWCHASVAGDWQKFRSTENYNRLSYNSAFPWQADGDKGEVAMNYVVKNAKEKWEALRLYTFKKYENGIYYRDAVLETDTNIVFHLADITIPDGIIRVDKIEYKGSDNKEINFRLGNYALPQLKVAIKDRTYNTQIGTCKSIDNGKYAMTMITNNDWGEMQFVHTTGLHPESYASAVVNASGKLNTEKQKEKIIVTVELWKKSGDEWSKKELNPIKKIKISKDKTCVYVIMKNQSQFIVCY